jgi:hypothetical protein
VLVRPFVEISQIQLLADVSVNTLLRRIADATSESSLIVEDRSENRALTKGEILRQHLLQMSGKAPAVYAPKESNERVVLLTGTTGALGCNVLHDLLRRHDITQVIAFNRSAQGIPIIARQAAAFREHGLDSSLTASPKLVLLEGDMSVPGFGLSEKDLRLVSFNHPINTKLTLT